MRQMKQGAVVQQPSREFVVAAVGVTALRRRPRFSGFMVVMFYVNSATAIVFLCLRFSCFVATKLEVFYNDTSDTLAILNLLHNRLILLTRVQGL